MHISFYSLDQVTTNQEYSLKSESAQIKYEVQLCIILSTGFFILGLYIIIIGSF